MDSLDRSLVSCQRPIVFGSSRRTCRAQFLQKQGYRILERGHRQRRAEVDLIALDGNCIVFVEVKTRQSDKDEDPSVAVDRRKQERLTRAALIYLKRHGLIEHPARFDVISVVWPDTRQPPESVISPTRSRRSDTIKCSARNSPCNHPNFHGSVSIDNAATNPRKAVVLLSGGLDSATVLAIAKAQGFDLYAISFRYGQRHSVELDRAQTAGSDVRCDAPCDYRY